MQGAEDQVGARMYKVNSDSWVWMPRPPLCLSQHSGNLASAVLTHREEEEEAELHVGCCNTQGCDGIISQATDAWWSPCELLVHSGFPSRSDLNGHDPRASSSQQPVIITETDQGDISQHFIGGHSWEGSRMETQGCVCVYGQRESEGLGPCWLGPPYSYYGVRTNMVVGVEVVEEVAVEEVITENIYSEALLDSETLQDDQLYPR